MKRTTAFLLTAAFAATLGFAAAVETEDAGAAAKAPRHVDLVICLDTSGSMQGLIESAKTKLWAVVNELATARPRPVLRVGLYQYGGSRLDPKAGWVEKMCDLTDDLDTVYGKLFALTAGGSTEYVARVIRSGTLEQKWSGESNALRIIFVAGNETAHQDKQYKLKDVCAAAAAKGIIINTIYCGQEAEGRSTGWADAARWADGRYAAIDQNGGTVTITTPHDKKLAQLGTELNKTYVAYGANGRGGADNQMLQDGNAAKLGVAVAAERAAGKANGLYRNSRWDLVDALKENKVDLAKVKAEELPEEMRKMNPEQRKAHVEKQARRRAELQTEIQSLNAKRGAYVKEQMARQGLSDKKAFDAALRSAVHAQAAKKGFKFQEAK